MASSQASGAPESGSTAANGVADAGTPVTIKIRQIGKPHDLTISLDHSPQETTVAQLKAFVASSVSVPADEQRLLFLGKLLQPDSATCDQFGIFRGCVVHLVQGRYVNGAVLHFKVYRAVFLFTERRMSPLQKRLANQQVLRLKPRKATSIHC